LRAQTFWFGVEGRLSGAERPNSMTAKREADHITPLKARSKRFRDQHCGRGHAARAVALAKRYQEQLDQVEELEGMEVSSSSERYVSGSEEVSTVGTDDTDKSWQPQHATK
jgi:hypothetical protein